MDILNIRCLISQLDMLGAEAQMRSVVDLLLLALSLRQRLIVGHFFDQGSNARAKQTFYLIQRGVSVFDCVMQQGGTEYIDVKISAHITNALCHFNWMIDVWGLFAIFTALLFVFFGGKSQGFQEQAQITLIVFLILFHTGNDSGKGRSRHK